MNKKTLSYISKLTFVAATVCCISNYAWAVDPLLELSRLSTSASVEASPYAFAKTDCSGGTTLNSAGQTLTCPFSSGVQCDLGKTNCACLLGKDEETNQEYAYNTCVAKPKIK